jgi:hypothetical protein
MWDSHRALDELRDALARTHREIVLLEQIGRQLEAITDGDCGEESEPLIQRHVDDVASRMARAMESLASVVRMMEEFGPRRPAWAPNP